MGRAKYTEEERKAIIASLITATKDLIAEEGMDNVSIRKVAARANCSSATLYLYFKDMDELMALSCIGYLEGYCRDLAAIMSELDTPKSTYYRALELFCQTTFAEPQVFLRLFFCQHTRSLNDLVRLYYSVFPEQLDNLSGRVLNMVLAGDLSERGLQLLRPYATELGFSENEVLVINDVLTSYYRSCLERARDANLKAPGVRGLTQHYIEVASFMLRRPHE